MLIVDQDVSSVEEVNVKCYLLSSVVYSTKFWYENSKSIVVINIKLQASIQLPLNNEVLNIPSSQYGNYYFTHTADSVIDGNNIAYNTAVASLCEDNKLNFTTNDFNCDKTHFEFEFIRGFYKIVACWEDDYSQRI